VPIEKKRRILIDDGKGHVHAARVTGTDTLPDGHRALDFTPALPAPIEAKDAVLLGNIARAGHGETQMDEVLGMATAASLPGLEPGQARPQPAPFGQVGRRRGGADVLVDGVRWDEADSLFGKAKDAPVYTLREQEDQKTLVRFGDGRTGARPPSGRGNVVARYRKGLGLARAGRAGQAHHPPDPAAGLRDATNPAAAEGGADPEAIDQSRQNAPVSVRTFGRIVSLTIFPGWRRRPARSPRPRRPGSGAGSTAACT